MAMHEDLSALFARNLTFNPYVAPVEPVPEVEAPYTYSISQHYHHSNHLIPQQQPERPASEPPQTDQHTTEIILARHGVDIGNMSPSQVELFQTADAGQQMRLIELWRICPPSYGGHALPQDLATGHSTTLQQEEALAKLRYERQMLEERMSRTGAGQDQYGMESIEDTMSDSSNPPLTPLQGGDGRWAGSHAAEPYMASGYESLAHYEYQQSAGPSKDIYSHFGTSIGGPTYNQSKYNHATDPVYNNNDNLAQMQLQQEQQRQYAMENQYGAFEQSFQQHYVGGHGGQDEEML